jgi:hypothetical protein
MVVGNEIKSLLLFLTKKFTTFRRLQTPLKIVIYLLLCFATSFFSHQWPPLTFKRFYIFGLKKKKKKFTRALQKAILQIWFSILKRLEKTRTYTTIY